MTLQLAPKYTEAAEDVMTVKVTFVELCHVCRTFDRRMGISDICQVGSDRSLNLPHLRWQI